MELSSIRRLHNSFIRGLLNEKVKLRGEKVGKKFKTTTSRTL
jgi:hypothetical protein